MDLRELLAGGGSVTEIRASEVLIIKPSPSPEERSGLAPGGGVKGREEGREVRRDGGRDQRRDQGKERTPIQEDRKCPNAVASERGKRVSQLLSRFGEHHKLTCRSKSSDSFVRFLRRKDSHDGNSEGDDEEEEAATTTRREVNGKNPAPRGVPKRSFSFSDRAVSVKENGVGHGELKLKNDAGRGRKTAEVAQSGPRRTPEKTAAPRLDRRSLEMADDAEGDRGFTVVPVRNTEGISFARRVPIRQEGRGAAVRVVQRDARPSRADAGGEDAGRAAAAPAGEGDVSRGPTATQSVTERSSLLCTVADLAARGGGGGGSGHFPAHPAQSLHSDARAPDASGQGGGGTRGALGVNDQAPGVRLFCDAAPGSPRRIRPPPGPPGPPPPGTPPGPLEIQIPRTVFYVAEDTIERKRRSFPSLEGQDGGQVGGGGGGGGDGGGGGGGGAGVERRDSWRIGKPLSRVESLREKIRQREREKEREREREMEMDLEGGGTMEREKLGLPEGDALQDARSRDGAPETAGSSSQAASDRCEVGGGVESDEEPPPASVAPLEERSAARGDKQEVLGAQASTDVTQEVGAFKNSPQLPVSVPFCAAVGGEEVAGTAAAPPLADLHPDAVRFSGGGDGDDDADDDEVDLLKHVEEELRRRVGWHREHESSEEEREEEEEEKEEEEEVLEEEVQQEEDFTSPDFSSESLTPSPPCHLDSPVEMSRIYNVKSVSSTRTGFCAREAAAAAAAPVHLVKVTPRLPQVLFDHNKPRPADLAPGVPALQQRLEKFQLTEQTVEPAQDGRSSPNTHKGNKGIQRVLDQQQKDQGTSSPTPRTPAWSQRVGSPISHLRPAQTSPSTQPRTTSASPAAVLRGQSPEEGPLRHAGEAAPTPFSSPVLCSPVQSPSISPSPPCSSSSSTTPLFSIRSASGSRGIKGATTITIKPRRSRGGGGGGGGGGGVVLVSATAITTSPGPTATQGQTLTSNAMPPPPPPPPGAEPMKKNRFPRVEEIEVIGGYENLERSCLVKNKGPTRKVSMDCAFMSFHVTFK